MALRYVILALLSWGFLNGNCEVLQVGTGKTYPHILDALKKAQNGDVIEVHSGEYHLSGLTINKSIHLKGVNNPIIDGQNKETILTFNVDSFSISGFIIKNVGQSYTKDFAAILVSRANYFEISNNTFENVFFGILLEKSHFGKVHHNHVKGEGDTEAGSGNGIHLWHCKNMEVHNNLVEGLRDGVYFEFVENTLIYNNHSRNNIRYGLHFMFSNHNEYHHNVFETNGAGVAVMFSKFIKMHHNKFIFNWGTASYGLLLKEIYDAEIIQNQFIQNTVGINAEGSTRINYKDNIFERNGYAVKITGACYENYFMNNVFASNAFDLSYNAHLNSNKFERNFWGDYTGYDLDKNGIGDVPYRPVKLFSYIVNRTPETIVLLRSLFVDMINFSEKVSPVFTPDDLLDNAPLMKRPTFQ